MLRVTPPVEGHTQQVGGRARTLLNESIWTDSPILAAHRIQISTDRENQVVAAA